MATASPAILGVGGPIGGRGPALLLASKSPRRADLLRRAGVAFEVVDSGVDDGALAKPPETPPSHWVAALAHLKARAARGRAASPDAVVLGADTMVVKQGRLIGQPADEDEAREIIESLQRGEHEVMTGVALLFPRGRRVVFTDVARVRVGEIARERIDAYVASGLWRGKAGAYNLEERLAEGWPIEHAGDPGTIMGLPMRRLLPALDRAIGREAAPA